MCASGESCFRPLRNSGHYTRLGPRILIVGVSTRAAAESAARAGFEVTAIDAFADLDQHPGVRSLSLPGDFGSAVSAGAAARAARTIDCDAVVYLSNLDNHPRAVAALAEGRTLWGNAPAVLRRVRDPRLLTEALHRRGMAAPSFQNGPPAFARAQAREGGRHVPGKWLVKPLASGGGRRVRPWDPSARVPRGCYLQEFVEGTPGSVVFVAAGGRAVPLGVSRQLIGEPAFGADRYRYCGNILAPAGDAQFARDETLLNAASALARAVTDEFGLAGVNGVDFIASDGVPHAIEVNPRWCASMELVERAYGLSVFGAHAAACASGDLPAFDLVRARSGATAHGKAVIFARRDFTAGDTLTWLGDATVRDVPHPGDRLQAGHPVCTVFAEARDAVECHAALVRRAERVYEAIAGWGSHSALPP